MQAFYLDGGAGRVLVVRHAPDPKLDKGLELLYLPPFGEEANKSRRMASLLARYMAASGVAVSLLDPYGCGDSEGELEDASWEIWRRDVAAAARHLVVEGSRKLVPWGLRTGALLALDTFRDLPNVAAVMLWQPYVKGSSAVTHFLRLRLAADLQKAPGPKPAGIRELRQALQSGELIDVAGFRVGWGLLGPMNELDLTRFPAPTVPVFWLEVAPGERSEPAVGSQRVITAWRESGHAPVSAVVPGEPFWATQEISQAPALIERSERILRSHL